MILDTSNPVVKAFLAGAVSGTCSTVILQPLDLVKTRLQNHARPEAASTSGSLSSCHPAPVEPCRSPGMIQVVRNIVATEQAVGLWRGMVPSIVKTVPGVGIYFGTLHWLKTRAGFAGTPAGTSGRNPTAVESVCLGMTARSFAAAIMIPFTVLKTRFESGKFGYTRMSVAISEIYRVEGIRGLTCGLVPTLVRDAPYSGLYLMFYSQLKEGFDVVFAQNDGVVVIVNAGSSGDGSSANAAVHFSCGLLAGFLASVVTHPADVIKTKMQTQTAGSSCRSVLAASKLVLAETGLKGFMAGFAPRMLRRALMSALAWTVYEGMIKRVGLK